MKRNKIQMQIKMPLQPKNLVAHRPLNNQLKLMLQY